MARCMDRLLPLAEKVKDLSDVAIFDKDDDRAGKYLDFSPGAALAFAELAVEYRAQPCERPAFTGLEVFYATEHSSGSFSATGGTAAVRSARRTGSDVRRRLRASNDPARTPDGASSGLGPGEQQSRNQERCSYGTAVRRQDEEDGARGQNEQGSSCLESVPGTFVRRSFIAESLSCGDIDAMAGRRSHKIA
jgi:hypothetical protein